MPDEDINGPEPGDEPPVVGDYGTPPTREQDRAGWMTWRSRVWGDCFEAMAKTLHALSEEVLSGRLSYDDDVAVGAALDGLGTAVVNAKAFYMQEAWETARERARDLVAGMQAGTEAPGLAEAFERLLGGDPGGGGQG